MTDTERILALEQARRNIEDSLLVMAELERKQSAILKQMAERQTELETENRAQRQRNAEVDVRIEKLVSAIGHLIGGRTTG